MKNKLEKLEQIGLAIVMFSLLLLFAFGCTTLDPATRYAKEHRYREYNTRSNNSVSFTFGSYKNDKNSLTKELREVKKNNSERDKINRLIQKNAELRKQIEELKKNN